MFTVNNTISTTTKLNDLVSELSVHRNDEIARINENNRRSLWVGVYRDVFGEGSTNLKRADTAKSFADKAVAAYDEQFGNK